MIQTDTSRYVMGCEQCRRAIKVEVSECPECGSGEVIQL